MRHGALLALLLCACDGGSPAAEADASPPAESGLAPLTLGPLVLGVWGAGPDDVWFVGGRLPPAAPDRFVGRFDGTAVRPESAPPGPALWWVWGDGTGRVRACGEAGRILVREADAWNEEPAGLDEKAVLWGLWGAAPDDLWAVGGSVRRGGPKGVVLRSAGDGHWRRVDDPALPADLNLYKVWGDGPDDVFIVGEGGLTVRWDGTSFRRVQAPVPDLLFTVSGRPGGPVLAVGGIDDGHVVRWDGGAWVDDEPPAVPALSGVFVQADGSARVVGARGTVLDRAADGTWRRLRATGLAGYTLHAAWGADWAVGGDLTAGEGGVIATTRRPLPALEGSAP